MQDTYTSFKVAKLAKDKLFNEECREYFTEEGEIQTLQYYEGSGGTIRNQDIDSEYANDTVICAAPTQSLLQKWLRDIHKIDVIPYPIEMQTDTRTLPQEEIEYNYSIWIKGVKQDVYFKGGTWEEALEFGLEEAFKLLP